MDGALLSDGPPDGPFRRAVAAYPSTGALVRGVAYALVVGGLLRTCDVLLLLPRPALLAAYVRLWRTNLRTSPYRRSSYAKIAAAKKLRVHVDEFTYGETPLCTAVVVGAAAGIGRDSVVVDPLAGRGRFLLGARRLGARARGVELLEDNHGYAAPILARVGVDLALADATTSDFGDATHVFLCWTCSAEATRAAIARRLRDTMAPGGKVLCVTWPLDDDDAFTTVWSRRYFFSWGRGDVSLHVRR